MLTRKGNISLRISNLTSAPAFLGITNATKLATAALEKAESSIALKAKPVDWAKIQAQMPWDTVGDNIKFEPAKTIEEAEKFAKDHLKMSFFRLTDLDCANYINEILTKNYNSSPDKRIIIRCCAPALARSSYPATISGNGFLEFNQNIENILKQSHEKYNSKAGFQVLHDKDLIKKCDLTKSQLKYLDCFKNNTYDELPFKEKIGYTMFLRGFGREEIPLTNSKKLALPDGGDSWIINHEIGHVRHKKNVDIKEYSKIQKDFCIQNNTKEYLMQKFKSAEPDWKSTQKISDYATQSPIEFVAEVYACLLNGVKFDDDVMQLYEKYGGPKILAN